MDDLKKIIKELEGKILAALTEARNEKDLEEVRLHYLTRQGPVAQLMTRLKTMSADEKRKYGPLLNNLRQKSDALFITREKEIKDAERELALKKKSQFDVTAYQPKTIFGSLHPYTYVIQKIEDVFISMGYAIVDSPEI